MCMHYSDVMMGTMASQITSLTIVYSTVYLGADQRKHQSSASLAFVPGIHRWPVNSLHKWPVTRKMFPFDDVVMVIWVSMVVADGLVFIWRQDKTTTCNHHMLTCTIHHQINSLWPSDTIWWHRSGSTLDQVMAWCLMAPSHYLNQCWLIISQVLWHSPKTNFTGSDQDITL